MPSVPPVLPVPPMPPGCELHQRQHEQLHGSQFAAALTQHLSTIINKIKNTMGLPVFIKSMFMRFY